MTSTSSRNSGRIDEPTVPRRRPVTGMPSMSTVLSLAEPPLIMVPTPSLAVPGAMLAAAMKSRPTSTPSRRISRSTTVDVLGSSRLMAAPLSVNSTTSPTGSSRAGSPVIWPAETRTPLTVWGCSPNAKVKV